MSDVSIKRQLDQLSIELRNLGSVVFTCSRRIHHCTVRRHEHAFCRPTFQRQRRRSSCSALTLDQLLDISANPIVPAYDAAGFNGNFIVTFLPNGNSTYHGASATLIRRFADGLQGSAAYTWSHLIDDTTAEVFSTVLSPRRVQDFQDLRPERADSALDRRHRFVLSGIYELPWFRNSSNRLVRTVLGGFNFAGTWTLESGQKATVLSGADSNLNADAAPDRTIRNRTASETRRFLLLR